MAIYLAFITFYNILKYKNFVVIYVFYIYPKIDSNETKNSFVLVSKRPKIKR